MSDKPNQSVVMYSTTWCPDCRRAKSFLQERGVKFVEVMIDGNPEAEGLVLRVNNGRRRVPTIQVGDRYFACSPFNAQQLAAELNVPLNR
jgi:glutaredoxin